MKIKKTSLSIALIAMEYTRGFRLESIPLNLSYIGAVLENNGYFVKGFNLGFEKLNEKNIKKFDVFGFSVPIAVFDGAIKLAEKIKKINPKAVIILGGPHPTACPNECLNVKAVDFVVVGEGEQTMLKMMQALEGKIPLNKIPNLAYRSGKKIIINPKQVVKDLDDLPFPAKNIFDVSLYPDKQKAYGDIIASRGCPFHCTNCKPALDKIAPYRIRKPEKVVEEMKCLKEKYGVKHFTFSDSELIGPTSWVKEFAKEIIKQKLRVTYSCNGRTDRINKEVLSLLKKSGCIFIGFGIESGSQEVIDQILKKGISLKRSKEVIAETEKIGIETGAWFMVGIPGENEDQVWQTIRFSQELTSSIIEINIATPWPDTGFYNISKEKGWLVSEDFSGMNEKRASFIETEFLSARRTQELFEIFQSELIKKGWKPDKTQSRFHHPFFPWRMLRLGVGTILHRGLVKDDLLKFTKWLKSQY